MRHVPHARRVRCWPPRRHACDACAHISDVPRETLLPLQRCVRRAAMRKITRSATILSLDDARHATRCAAFYCHAIARHGVKD